LISISLQTSGTIHHSNNNKDFNQKTELFTLHLFKQTSNLKGYKIGVINTGSSPEEVKSQLETWGATVDLISIDQITLTLLSNYCAIWIPVEASMELDNDGKDDEIRDYVFLGGGLIFCQPNNDDGLYIPQCLPYTWEIVDNLFSNPCATTIVNPNHELTFDLTIDDMPDCYETMGTISPEYKILALSADGEPSFACTNYGMGRVIVQMDATLRGEDICGDIPPLSKKMVIRMLKWVCKELICCNGVGMNFGYVKPGDIVYGEIEICNSGNAGSLLDWYIDTTNLPNWGNWIFSQNNGTSLEGGNCDFVTVTCELTEKKGNYNDQIFIYNEDDPTNFCTILTSAVVPKNTIAKFPKNIITIYLLK
jgi:hypothetical protein